MEKAKVSEILDHLCQKIGGDWLLIGGTLVQIHYDGERATEDIDLVQMGHAEKSREAVQDELFQFTIKKWGMGPEFVNLSAEFFVRSFQGWENDRVLLQSGTRGRVWRPTLTLFCALKMQRGSELDLDDIRVALKKGEEKIELDKLKSWLTPKKMELFLSLTI